MKEQIKRRGAADEGFTLIELLIAIVVVGILTAVVIVGVGSLTNTGSKSACKASRDAAIAASNVHYANQTPNAWPATFGDMINAVPTPELDVSNVTYDPATPTVLTGSGWTLTMTAGSPPTFAGCPA